MRDSAISAVCAGGGIDGGDHPVAGIKQDDAVASGARNSDPVKSGRERPVLVEQIIALFRLVAMVRLQGLGDGPTRSVE